MDEVKSRQIEVLETLMAEYEAKALALKNHLSGVGIREDMFPNETLMVIQDLAEAATILNLKDATEISFTVALTKLKVDNIALSVENSKLQYENTQLKDDREKMEFLKNKIINNVIPEAATKINDTKLKNHKLASNLNEIKRKNKEILSDLNLLKNETSLLDESLTHQDIVSKSQILEDKNKVKKDLEKELAAFNQLPTNLNEAQAALKEIKNLLEIQESKMDFKQ